MYKVKNLPEQTKLAKIQITAETYNNRTMCLIERIKNHIYYEFSLNSKGATWRILLGMLGMLGTCTLA